MFFCLAALRERESVCDLVENQEHAQQASAAVADWSVEMLCHVGVTVDLASFRCPGGPCLRG